MKRIAIATVLALVASGAFARVEVADPWVRATVPAQRATGAFMRLTADKDMRLVGARSPVAEVAEVHEMKLEGQIMKMGRIPALELPAGKTVELKPGGYHVMLLGLKGQVKAGGTVPLTLLLEGKDGARETVDLDVPVRALGAAEHQPLPAMK